MLISLKMIIICNSCFAKAITLKFEGMEFAHMKNYIL